MKFSILLVAAIGIIGFGAAIVDQNHYLRVGASQPPVNDLVVHEWGTFTSIAGSNGIAVDWQPLNGPSDLPKFVYTVANHKGFRGTYSDPGKGALARVRMETPVIYFYTQKKMDVDVKVDFPNGKITEWYPQASVVNAEYLPNKTGRDPAGINWGTIRLLPGANPAYLREPADSHYYPARETDSVPIQVCDAGKTRIETEKFLFYRGIGNFTLPLKVRLEGNVLTLGTTEDVFGPKSDPGRNINNAIVFENRGGHIGFEIVPSVSGDTPVVRPRLDRNINDLYAELEKLLVQQGLYEKEARAMIATWKDSWFEEGLRVFYILPRRTTDDVLPLTIEPAPRETVRILVGRTEVVTPEMANDVRRQVNLLRSSSAATRRSAADGLKRHGRFYLPILRGILASERDPRARRQIERLLSVTS